MAETKPPKVFISYAWEDDLKTWVLEFATRLRFDGINAILDQWETVPGDQLPEFMEKSVRESDFVVFVCTPTYKRKSDRRKGGVGYEGHIITGEVFQKNNHRKFIPILRKGKWVSAAPSWAVSKLFIDFRGEPYPEASYEQLLNTLFRKSPTAPPMRHDKLWETVEREAAEKAQDESVEENVVKKTAQITWEPTDALHDGKPYISIDITSRENRLINCYSYIKSLELNGVVRNDIKNKLVEHTNRVSWSGGSDEEVGIKNIDPKGFGKINLVSLKVEDFTRNFLQFETAKGPQSKDKDGNLLPFGTYIIDLGLSCASNGVDFEDVPIKIGFEYIEEHDYFEDNRIISGRETRKVLRLLKIEMSESISGLARPKEVIISEKDVKNGQEKRMFYDLTAHYECDFENTTAETLANFLLESLTRIMRTVAHIDKSDADRTVEYQTSQVEYFDPKDGKTTQHTLIVHGRKVQLLSKGNHQGVDPLTTVSEMLIITVTQGVNGSRLRFDSNELPNEPFKDLVEWILLDLGKDVSVQVESAISEKAPLTKQNQPATKMPEKQERNATEKVKEEKKQRELERALKKISNDSKRRIQKIEWQYRWETFIGEVRYRLKLFRINSVPILIILIGLAVIIPLSVDLYNRFPELTQALNSVPTTTLTTHLITPSQTLVPSQTRTKFPTLTLTPTKTKIPTLTPTFTPIPRSSILFQRDFEGGVVSEWSHKGGIWVIEQEPDGNDYLSGSSSEANPNPSQIQYTYQKTRWTDYALETRVKFVTGRTLYILIRSDVGSGEFYGIAINDSGFSFMRTWSMIGKNIPMTLAPNRWYTIRVEIMGDLLSAYIDDALFQELKLQPPLIDHGGIGFVIDGDKVYFDDIKAWSLK